MEISGSDFAYICGVSRQTIYALWKKNKLEKSGAKKFNVNDPLNLEYLKEHGKSTLDVKKYVDLGRKPYARRDRFPDVLNGEEKPDNFKPRNNYSSSCRSNTQKNQPEQQKTNDQSDILFKSVDIVITRKYSSDEAREVKNLIFQEMGKYV